MRAAVPVPNFVDQCAIPWARVQYRQPALQRSNRLKTPAMSIAGEIAGGASDDPRSSNGTAEATRRRLCDTSLERGHRRQVHGRIKLGAFQRGVTVADILREMPEHASQ